MGLRGQRLGVADHAGSRMPVGQVDGLRQRLTQQRPLLVFIWAVRYRAEAEDAFAVSMTAASTPSSEVPLINPMARTIATFLNALPHFESGTRPCYTTGKSEHSR
jgi:hypothetical protein